MKLTILLPLIPLALAVPAPLERRANPTVIAPSPQATVAGTSIANVESFKGIPYAQPPIDQLRLKPPQPLTSSLGKVDGTGIPKACPQFFFSIDERNIPTNVLGTILNLPLLQTVTNAGEDCLTVNVQRPAGTKADAKLPVLFWIFGGGFELGSTAMYDGASLVAESVAQGKPIVFVAVNYRVGGFGFMPGKEVLEDGSANLGLLDQRLGLQWVADNIAAFGGDPEKVTIWGESAGAISVLDQMMLYDGDNSYKGKPLFRAGIMNSGSIVPENGGPLLTTTGCRSSWMRWLRRYFGMPPYSSIHEIPQCRKYCSWYLELLYSQSFLSTTTRWKSPNSIPRCPCQGWKVRQGALHCWRPRG